MATSNLSPPKVVSKQEWLAARKAFFFKEKAMTHALDALRAERRRLPWVKVEKPYVFDGHEGECTLKDLFRTAASSPSITSCSGRVPITSVKAVRSSPIISTRRGSTLATLICHLP